MNVPDQQKASSGSSEGDKCDWPALVFSCDLDISVGSLMAGGLLMYCLIIGKPLPYWTLFALLCWAVPFSQKHFILVENTQYFTLSNYFAALGVFCLFSCLSSPRTWELLIPSRW